MAGFSATLLAEPRQSGLGLGHWRARNHPTFFAALHSVQVLLCALRHLVGHAHSSASSFWSGPSTLVPCVRNMPWLGAYTLVSCVFVHVCGLTFIMGLLWSGLVSLVPCCCGMSCTPSEFFLQKLAWYVRLLAAHISDCVSSPVGARTVPVSLASPPECLRPGGINIVPSTCSSPRRTQD